MSKKYGYTLAEVLISMLVIGVIAAVCTPMIMNVIPNKNAIMIKKAYYAVDNIVKILINDSYYYPNMSANCYGTDENGNVSYIGKADENECFFGFDYAENTSTELKIKSSSGNLPSDQNAKNKFRKLFISYLDTKRPLSKYLANNVVDGDFEFIPTSDGLVYNLKNDGDDNDFEYSFVIMVDVNGTKGPNAFAPSYNNGNNKCASYATWTPTTAGGHFDNRKFDRIVIEVSSDGLVSIPDNQVEFINIITTTDSEFKKDNSSN